MMFVITANSQPMKIKGEYTDCSPSELVDRFQAQGLKWVGSNHGNPLMQGEFAGFYNSLFEIVGNSSDSVKLVAITVRSSSEWDQLVSAYDRLKANLQIIYGESFDSELLRNSSETEAEKISLLKESPFMFTCGFYIGGAKIVELCITADVLNQDSGSVKVTYMDISMFEDFDQTMLDLNDGNKDIQYN